MRQGDREARRGIEGKQLSPLSTLKGRADHEGVEAANKNTPIEKK